MVRFSTAGATCKRPARERPLGRTTSPMSKGVLSELKLGRDVLTRCLARHQGDLGCHGTAIFLRGVMRLFGQITMMESSRGFGFITADNGMDHFFHMSGCRAFKSLRMQDRVSFVPVSAAKGPRAEDIAVASQP